jgi:SPP1 gp7 family putative phage head morphogenesis protein
MITLEKKKIISHNVKKFLYITKVIPKQIRIESKLQLHLVNIFKNHSRKFWTLEKEKDILNKCYLQAQKDLSEIKKMGMSNNPEDRIKFISELTEEWYTDINSDEMIYKNLIDSYVEGYNFGGQESLNEFKIDENFKLRNLDILNSLNKRANSTSDQINETSWDLLKGRIADSFWKEGKGVDAVARDIRDLFEETYKHRAENIAITEIGNVVSEATLNSYKAMGVEQKEWGTELDACELCAPLDGQIINVGESFNNGNGWIGDSPLVHPRCRCFLMAVVPKDFVPDNIWTGD